ncbi:MAG: NYN domain-containing protein [Oscillospiraceae bacterium]|nr:NYN domain-containing protein [Oscillospiraceae bacterium]
MEDKNIALLIDADNVSAKYVKSIFDELNSYGTVSIRRIYGNWQKTYKWDERILLEYSIQPIQQFDYTAGKNATDMAMVIDAMDILYTKNVDIFCIITSDSDFTKLAMRLRESQAFVIGMGESKTPIALTKACNKFVHLDLIAPDIPKTEESEKPKTDEHRKTPEDDKSVLCETPNVTPLEKIQEAVMNRIVESDTVTLGEVGSLLGKQFTDFDVRNYGYTKLSVLMREEFKKINLLEEGNKFYVTMKNDVSIDMVRREIIDFIMGCGGEVSNLSKIHDALKKKHKDFSLKDYGFSRFSNFIRSIDGISVYGNGNKVKLEQAKKKTKPESTKNK